MISFKDAVKNGFKKTFVYRSRASRSEFWWFMLFIALCYGVLLIMFALLGLLLSSYMFTHEAEKVIEEISLPISYIFVLCFVLPILSLTIRRLHDSDSSAWYLLCFIVGYNIFSAVMKAAEYESSILGALLLFVLSLPILLLSIIPSTPGINKYGMNPSECNYSSGLDKRKVKKYVNPINCIKNGFVNIFKFSGRATRTEFWWFALFYSIFLTVSILVMKEIKSSQIPIIICIIVTTIAFISLFIRRIHDSNHSGWYLLLGFLGAPYYLCLIEGDIDDNDYGPSPYETNEPNVQNNEDITDVNIEGPIKLKDFEESDHRRYMPGYVENINGPEEECCTTIALPQIENNRYLGLSLVKVLSLEVVYDKESVKCITQLAYYNLSKSISSDNDCYIDDLPLHKEYGSVIGDRLYRIALLLERKESLYEAIQYIRQKEMEAWGFDHVSWGPIEDDDSIDTMIFADLVSLPQSVYDFYYPHYSVWLEKLKGKLVDCNNPQEKVVARGNELHEKVCTYIEDFVCVNQD